MEKIKIIRQGDVIVVPFNSEIAKQIVGDVGIRDEWFTNEKIVIHGEEHDHVLEGNYRSYKAGEDFWIADVDEAELKHPEHGKVKLSKGIYIIMRIFDWLTRVLRFGQTRIRD